jgi:hypothetical protein
MLGGVETGARVSSAALAGRPSNTDRRRSPAPNEAAAFLICARSAAARGDQVKDVGLVTLGSVLRLSSSVGKFEQHRTLVPDTRVFGFGRRLVLLLAGGFCFPLPPGCSTGGEIIIADRATGSTIP